MYSPYPEEMNRCLTGKLANLHFAPTMRNKQNLLKENVNENNIVVTGNTVIDALLDVIDEKYIFKDENINKVNFRNKKVILLTVHRRENLGKPMENIIQCSKKIVKKKSRCRSHFPGSLKSKG